MHFRNSEKRVYFHCCANDIILRYRAHCRILYYMLFIGVALKSVEFDLWNNESSECTYIFIIVGGVDIAYVWANINWYECFVICRHRHSSICEWCKPNASIYVLCMCVYSVYVILETYKMLVPYTLASVAIWLNMVRNAFTELCKCYAAFEAWKDTFRTQRIFEYLYHQISYVYVTLQQANKSNGKTRQFWSVFHRRWCCASMSSTNNIDLEISNPRQDGFDASHTKSTGTGIGVTMEQPLNMRLHPKMNVCYHYYYYNYCFTPFVLKIQKQLHNKCVASCWSVRGSNTMVVVAVADANGCDINQMGMK